MLIFDESIRVESLMYRSFLEILEAKRKRLKMEPKLKVKEKGLLDEAKGPPAPLEMERRVCVWVC